MYYSLTEPSFNIVGAETPQKEREIMLFLSSAIPSR